MNNTTIERKQEVKYLGVLIDQKLTWKPHINYVKNKISKCMWALTKIRPYVNVPTMKLIYYSLAYSHLQYCTCWGGASRSALNPLISKQKSLARIILKQPYLAHSDPLFASLEFLKIDQIYNHKIGVLMHKNKSGTIQMPQNFSLISDLHNHNTRAHSNSNYILPKAICNKLPFLIVDQKSGMEFLLKLDLYLLQIVLKHNTNLTYFILEPNLF